jgi:hypothetical protein
MTNKGNRSGAVSWERDLKLRRVSDVRSGHVSDIPEKDWERSTIRATSNKRIAVSGGRLVLITSPSPTN